MPNRFLLSGCLALLLASCSTSPPRPGPTPAVPAAPHVVVVAEAYASADIPAEELDSLATWVTEDGNTWLIATGKSSHRLLVLDAATGAQLRTFGTQGDAPGEFNRPNGLAVSGDHLFVVERDNHRVQVFSLPGLTALGSFGERELRSPYGLWLHETEPGELEAYVTDSFQYGEKFDVLPPSHELDQRVRRYRISFDQHGRVLSSYGGSFGDTSDAAGLRMVESIAGDPAHDRLLIADEDRRHESTLREYTFSGRYTGRSLPQDSFGAEAEGVALWSCPDGNGYWIAVDQLSPRTIFHLFDRITLAPRGSFRGEVTAHTDGVALHAAASGRFPGGALFAVHGDKAVTAFDLRDVVDGLGLAQACVH